MGNIADEEIIGSAAAVLGRSRNYLIQSATRANGGLNLQFKTSTKSAVYGVILPLPSSELAQPWVYDEPNDADDWLEMLSIWLDEQIGTGAPKWASQKDVQGVAYFEVATYGFRHGDPVEHARLEASI